MWIPEPLLLQQCGYLDHLTSAALCNLESMYTTPYIQAEAMLLQGHGGADKLPLPFWEWVDVQGAPDQAG